MMMTMTTIPKNKNEPDCLAMAGSNISAKVKLKVGFMENIKYEIKK